FPNALVSGSDGSLCGGGEAILRLELDGALTSLAASNDLGSASRFLVFGKDGNLYGTTDSGGSGGGGTFFRLNIPGAGSPKIISTRLKHKLRGGRMKWKNCARQGPVLLSGR